MSGALEKVIGEKLGVSGNCRRLLLIPRDYDVKIMDYLSALLQKDTLELLF